MNDRRKAIIELVNRSGEINFKLLKENFPDVSDATLRTDLRQLDADGKIVRIHGGAKSISIATGKVDNYYTRSSRNVDKKQEIAKKAISLLEPQMSLYISAGSSCTELAKIIPDIPLNIFTDGVITAMELTKLEKVRITVLGGELATNGVRLKGYDVIAKLNTLRFDYAFCGTDGYVIKYGFVCYEAYEEAIFRILAERSDKLALLMDSSKANPMHSARFFQADNVDILISDSALDKDIKDDLTINGVSVM